MYACGAGRWICSVVALSFVLAACNNDGRRDDGVPALLAPPPEPAACENRVPHKRALFGETHIHTGFSLDAVAFGAGNKTPETATRFARGEAIDHPLASVGRVQLARPLDFVVVTDHAEFFDVIGMCVDDPGHPRFQDPFCRRLRGNSVRALTIWTEGLLELVDVGRFQPADLDRGRRRIWHKTQNTANRHYDPCRFTTLIGYEWTGGTIGGQAARGNLHRNVLFANQHVPEFPVDARRYPKERAFWQGLVDTCLDRSDGAPCDTIAIPHNSNLSRDGEMWAVETPEQAELRARIERLAEIYQHKGASECGNQNLDPQDGAFDPACDFELIRFESLADAALGAGGDGSGRRKGMVRAALAKGLREARALGFNPLELGIIAATDSHNATAGLVDESRYFGNHGRFLEADDVQRLRASRERSPGGLAGVWAEENTRGAVFAALKRRETFGTSGPRIKVRFYATDATAAFCQDAAFPQAVASRENTVPMGGVVAPDAAPVFVAQARADRVPLARLQIVRVRAGAEAFPDTAVIDVASAPAGAETLCAVWRDPAHDPDVAAAYYVRVLQQPTPRWTEYACRRQPELCAQDPPQAVRERAWTSPIWLYPEPPTGP